MEKSALLRPMQVRFTEPRDVERYGDGWHTYDELALVTTPARDLIRLEARLGLTIVDAMRGMRESSVLGDTAAAWLALQMGGSEIPFEDFSPAIMLAVWREKPVDEDPKDAPGAVSPMTPEDLASEAPAYSETGLVPTNIDYGTTPLDSVVLPTIPLAGSSS
jgi:hypothetical protein